jgi:ABC-type branched-subunit amino acid transport system ATPase component
MLLAPMIHAESCVVAAVPKEAGQQILVIDKNLSAVLRLVDRIVVLETRHSVRTNTGAPSGSVRGRWLHL